MQMYYVYTDNDSNVKVFRCADKATASALAKALQAGDDEHFGNDDVIVTKSVRRLTSELYRPYRDEGEDYGDVKDAFQAWLAGSAVVNNVTTAVNVGHGIETPDNWWFGLDDSRGDTYIYHRGVN
jgi:hypothetical protein